MKLKNNMTLQINEAEKADAAKIIEYLNLVGGESDNLLFGANEFGASVEAEESFVERMAGEKASALFIGKIDGEIVCVGSFNSPSRARIAHNADLAISVKKKYWGLGVATHLMQTMIDFAKANGQTKSLNLGVRCGNESAKALYTTMGFSEIGKYKNRIKINGKYYDEILMARIID